MGPGEQGLKGSLRASRPPSAPSAFLLDYRTIRMRGAMQIRTIKWQAVALLFVSVALSRSASAQNDRPWRDKNDPYPYPKDVQAACDKADNLQVPVGDTPTRADRPVLRHCKSRDLYYGIGVDTNYTVARKCAFNERAGGENEDIEGASVLMMIYANGYGAEKNLDLAVKFACEAGANIEDRILHLRELENKPPNQPLKECIGDTTLSADYCSGKFDFCDDTTSGYMQGVCALKDADITEAKSSASMRKLVSTWPVEHQKSFAALAKIGDVYFETHADHEVDTSGTGRAAFEIEAKESMREKCRASIRNFEHGQTPSYSSEDFAKANRRLGVVYAAAMKDVLKHDPYIGISRQGIRQTEKSWLAYRDAWVKFAALRYPAVSSQSIKTWLTLSAPKL